MKDKRDSIQLSDILIPHTNHNERDFTQSYGRPDRNDGILNNTFVEDTITADKSYLQDPDLTQRVSVLNDKKNQYTQINNQLGQIDEVIASRNYGRGITQLGQRGLQTSEARRLTSVGNNVAADIEELRGNIQSAEELRRANEKYAKSKAGSSSFDTLIGDSNNDGELSVIENEMLTDSQREDMEKEFLLNDFINERDSGEFEKGFSDLSVTDFSKLSKEKQIETIRKYRNKQGRADERRESEIRSNQQAYGLTGGAVTSPTIFPFGINNNRSNFEKLI